MKTCFGFTLCRTECIKVLLRPLSYCQVGIYLSKYALPKTVLWSLEGGCYAPILQMENWRNERCRESLMNTVIASDPLGLLVSVALCFGSIPGQRGSTLAVIEKWCSASSLDCHDVFLKIMIDQTSENTVAWVGPDWVLWGRPRAWICLLFIPTPVPRHSQNSLRQYLNQSGKVCGKGQSLNDNHHLVSLKMKCARKVGHPKWCL